MAFYDPTMLEVHVLLVDNDVNRLHETSLLLESNSYKVTAVDEVSAASSMLSKGKATFDLVMIDISSSNLEGYKLLHEAVNMDLTVILMSSNANATLVKCAIEDGAFLFLEKPTTVEELKYLWQHVLREKTRKSKEKGKRREAINNHNQNYYSITEGMTMNQYVARNKETCQIKGTLEHTNYVNSENSFSDPFMRSKFCTEWTPELHEIFMAAVRQLGEGRCFPKDILELMNVPGLTRMQVASHLQKCRYGWQPPHERNGRRLRAPKSSTSSDHSHRSKIKRYGLFPHLIKGSPPQFALQVNQNDEQGHIATNLSIENSTPWNNTHNIGEQGTLITIANNSNMNEISSENVLGNMVAAPNQGLQLSDTSFEFLANDDALIANNFDLQDLDFDHFVPGGETTDGDDRQKESEFWTSWIAEFARD